MKHSVGEYVRGMVHTNGVESFWSTLKRAHKGTFHKLSPKHLDRYVGVRGEAQHPGCGYAGADDHRRLDSSEGGSCTASSSSRTVGTQALGASGWLIDTRKKLIQDHVVIVPDFLRRKNWQKPQHGEDLLAIRTPTTSTNCRGGQTRIRMVTTSLQRRSTDFGMRCTWDKATCRIDATQH